MSRLSPHPVTRGIGGSPAHKAPRALTQSPRASLASITPALTAAPPHFHYRSSSHTDSHVRRAHTDLPDEDCGASAANASITSPLSASSVQTTPIKASRRVAPASQPLSTTSSPGSATTALASATPGPSLQPADLSTWEDDDSVLHCRTCTSRFTLFLRKHHCRQCGRIFCDTCSRGRRRLRATASDELVRVCDGCDRMLALDDDDERSNTRPAQPHSQPSKQPATPTHHTPTTATTPTSDAMSPISLAGDALDGSRLAAVSGSGVLDWTPLVAALLAEVECGERLRRVQDRMRDEMEAMVRLLAAEVAASAGKQAVEVDVAS